MKVFLEPRSVVLIGVSRKSGSGAYNNLEMMLRYGFKGQIYLVHNKVPKILGKKTYPNVAQLPEIPDLAVISVGRERVLPIFSECVAKGIKRLIVISQGFKDADEKGKELERQLVRISRENEARVIGPNTMGILNAFSCFSSSFLDIPRDPSPPPLTIVTQTGFFHYEFGKLEGQVGKAIDLGNTCDVDFVDVLRFLEKDPQTRIIVLHMEGIFRGREFLEVASHITRKKPIIILKTGRSLQGARIALSHTGSLVGEDAVCDLAFKKVGIIRVRNVIELKAVCRAFLKFRPMKGPRLAIVTISGVFGVLGADLCEDYELTLAPLSEKIRKQLEEPRIGWHRLGNPLDIWPLVMVSGSLVNTATRALKCLIQDSQTDAILAIVPAPSSPLHKDWNIITALKNILASNYNHKPIAFFFEGAGTQGLRLGQLADVACFGSVEEAIMGLAATWRYKQISDQRKASKKVFFPSLSKRSKPMVLPPISSIIGKPAFELLEHYKIPLAQYRIAKDAESIVRSAREIGYPVVSKIISPEWLHKSDWGGVYFNIRSEAELRKSFTELTNLFYKQTPKGELIGILVQKQIQGVELLFGIKKDTQFGQVVAIGMGGIYTEVFGDIQQALLPLTRKDAESMVQSLRGFPILKGMRGERGVRLNDPINILMSLSRLGQDYEEICALDLNPVIANSEGCWCVDCRIILE